MRWCVRFVGDVGVLGLTHHKTSEFTFPHNHTHTQVGTFDTGRRGKQAALLLVLLVLLVLGLLASVGVYLIRAIVLGGAKG